MFTVGLIADRVKCFSIPSLFSDHVALGFQYSVPVTSSLRYTRLRINIPPKYCPNYIDYMTQQLPTFDMGSAENLYSSLVSTTHEFYKQFVSRPHLQRSRNAHSWTFDTRIQEAREQAEHDGHLFRTDSTPETLHRTRGPGTT